MFNKENLKYFEVPDQADKWVWRINHGVCDWVKRYYKSFWYIVLWESKRAGILKKSITRKQFATLLVQECPEALSEGDTVDKILYCIEKFSYKSNLKDYDKQPDASFIRLYVKEVSDLLTQDITTENNVQTYTLEQRMYQFLTTTTANENYTKVCVHPIYNGKTATMSLENYMSQRFMDEHRPSRTVIFECVDETLTEEKVEMLYGRFGSLSNTKLFIASTHTFSGSVKKEAELHDIGLVLVNPQNEVEDNCFVLPRTQGSALSEELSWYRMLEGKERMTVPLLTYDNSRIDDSLSFILYKHASCDKKNLFVAAPVLSDAEIEERALELVAFLVQTYVSQLSQCGPNDKVPVCEIDPYLVAIGMGLTVRRGETGQKLGLIDISQKRVTLSNRRKDNEPSDRFSLAHEIGHSIFHRLVSEKAGDGCHNIVANTKKWLEHHANYFASCLLMPAPVIRLLYEIYWKKEFKSEMIAPLHVNNDYYNDPIFQRVIGPIARKMKVSLQAACIRLKKLGLLIEET